MIMPGFAPWVKMPHRKRIDNLCIEARIGISGCGGGLVIRCITGRRDQGAGGAIDAQTIFDRELEVRLRINCSRQMVVQISSLGHLLEKNSEKIGAVAKRFEAARGLLFRIGALRGKTRTLQQKQTRNKHYCPRGPASSARNRAQRDPRNGKRHMRQYTLQFPF